MFSRDVFGNCIGTALELRGIKVQPSFPSLKKIPPKGSPDRLTLID